MGAQLIMPGAKGETDVLRWDQPCVGVQWSGKILREQSFLINGVSSSTVNLQLSNPGLEDWASRGGLALYVEYRKSGCLGADSECWFSISEAAATGVPVVGGNGNQLRSVAVDWETAGLGLNGEYDLRARTMCDVEGTEAWSSIVTGTVDTVAPLVTGVVSTSYGRSVGPQDEVRAIFSEPIMCSGRFAEQLAVELSDGSTSLSLASADLAVRCEGTAMIISRAEKTGTGIIGLPPANAVQVIVSGVQDRAGNLLAGPHSSSLADGTNSKRLQQIFASIATGRQRRTEVTASEARNEVAAEPANPPTKLNAWQIAILVFGGVTQCITLGAVAAVLVRLRTRNHANNEKALLLPSHHTGVT